MENQKRTDKDILKILQIEDVLEMKEKMLEALNPLIYSVVDKTNPKKI
jgi:hypothetical protein